MLLVGWLVGWLEPRLVVNKTVLVKTRNHSSYDEMRSWEEEDQRGEGGVQTEPDQTEPVDDHGGKLPVIDDQLLLVLVSQSSCQRPQLLQYHLHLGRKEGDEGGAGEVVPVAAAAVVVGLHDVGVGQHVIQGPETPPVTEDTVGSHGSLE